MTVRCQLAHVDVFADGIPSGQRGLREVLGHEAHLAHRRKIRVVEIAARAIRRDCEFAGTPASRPPEQQAKPCRSLPRSSEYRSCPRRGSLAGTPRRTASRSPIEIWSARAVVCEEFDCERLREHDIGSHGLDLPADIFLAGERRRSPRGRCRRCRSRRPASSARREPYSREAPRSPGSTSQTN